MLRAFVAAAFAVSAASAAETITFELSISAGADWRYASDLVDTRVAPQIGFDVGVVRAAPAQNAFLWPIGISIGEHGDLLGSSRGETAVFDVGVVFSLWRAGPHDVRLTIGPDVITADRSGEGAYRNATAVGGSAALDYRWWFRPDLIAVGARVADDQAIVGRGGVRRSIGAGALSLILTERF